jgi:TonB family protein
MSQLKRKILSSVCVLALAGNGLGVGLAQDKKKERMSETDERPPIIVTQEGQSISIQQGNLPDSNVMMVEPYAQDVVMAGVAGGFGQQGGDNVFHFFSQEMSFENRTVKGAPFSADTLSETIQTLSDGNRIVQRTEGRAFRDGEGRTRQERSFQMGGANERQQTINIFDPVANVSIFLEPEQKIARKMNMFARTSYFGSAAPVAVTPTQIASATAGGGQGGVVEFSTATSANTGGQVGVQGARIMAPSNALQNNAIKRVQPTYPPAAKEAKVAGSVQVKISISETGDVVEATAVSGPPMLRDAAVEAAKQWKFKPAEVLGKAAPADGVLTFNFSLLRELVTSSAPGSSDRPMKRVERLNAPPMAMGRLSNSFEPMSQTKTESLGKQMVEGVECDGTRAIMTLPAGVIGNERPIETVVENWYSPELSMMILSKRIDPRFGETSYRVTNINRAEPDPGLFQIPSDYTLKEGPPFAVATPALPAQIESRPAGDVEIRKPKPDQQ